VADTYHASPVQAEQAAPTEAGEVAGKRAARRKQPQMRYQGVEILLAKFEREP